MGTSKFILAFTIISLSLVTCKAQKSEVPISISDIKTKTISQSTGDTEFTTAYLMGKFDPSTHPDFTSIPAKYRDEEIRYIRKDVLEAFIKMYEAAAKDGVYIKIRSATRNFENQKRIWENKWTGKTILEDNVNAAQDIKNDIERAKKILQYSSMPGTSRHHWGTDMDFNSFDNKWFESGEGLKIYLWLSANASQYGFCQPYTKHGTDRNTGYYEEKWHWTYMPISEQLTELAASSLTNDMISGFLGSDTAVEIDVVKNYILGISPSCKIQH